MGPMFVIFLTVLLDLIGFGIVIPLLSFYAEDFGASALQVTLLMACYSLAQFLFAPLWGALSDRYGRRPILLMSIGIGTLMLAGFGFSTTLWMLFLFRSLHGVFAANISVAYAYVADITTPENRAKGMGMLGAAFGLGFTLGPWVGGEFSVWGLAAPIKVAAALSAVNFVLALFVLPESRPRGTSAPGTSRPRPINPAALLSMLRHPAVGRGLTLSFVLVLAFAMMESTFALFEEHVHGLTARDIGRLLGVVGVVMVGVQGGAIGPMVKRFGERALVRVGVPGLAVTLFALSVAPPWAPLLAVCAAMALFNGLANPSLYAIISRSASEDEQGLVLGTNQSLAALARTVGPAIAGLLFTHVAQGAAFQVAAGLLCLGALLSWGLPQPAPKDGSSAHG